MSKKRPELNKRDRLEFITKILNEKGRCRVMELANLLNIPYETIRSVMWIPSRKSNNLRNVPTLDQLPKVTEPRFISRNINILNKFKVRAIDSEWDVAPAVYILGKSRRFHQNQGLEHPHLSSERLQMSCLFVGHSEKPWFSEERLYELIYLGCDTIAIYYVDSQKIRELTVLYLTYMLKPTYLTEDELKLPKNCLVHPYDE